MGAVYRARRILLGDDVAIKVILADVQGPAPLERFVRESRACAQLRHPNIVSILDYNADDPQRPFLVMELLSGPSLKDELAQRGRLPARGRAADHAAGVLGAGAGARARHHSPRPEAGQHRRARLRAAASRVYKVVDFGVATVRQSGDETRLTGSQQFIGTVAYASPEQLTGGIVDARSDVYSLGVLLFELVSGRLPFEGSDPMAVVSAHLSKPAPTLSAVFPGLPVWLDVAVGRALAKAPEDRWQDMASFGRAVSAPDAIRVADGARAGGGLLGTYEIGETLGPGRLGSTVHRGVHRALGHPVAIRILRSVTRARRGGAGPFPPRGPRAAGRASVDHPCPRLRRRGRPGVCRHGLHRRVRACASCSTSAGALPWPRLSRFVTQLLEATHVLHRRKGLLCGLSPDIVRVGRRGRLGAPDDLERGHLGCAGSAGHAAGTDAARHGARRFRASLRGPGALHGTDGRRQVGRLHPGCADLRDGDRRSAVRRCHTAGADGEDAHGLAPRPARAAAVAAGAGGGGDSDRAQQRAREAVRGRPRVPGGIPGRRRSPEAQRLADPVSSAS